MEELAQRRHRMDEIDRELVALLNERAENAVAIGQLKEAVGLPVYQPTREAEVLQNVRRANRGPLDDEAIARLFERIIDEARRLEGHPGGRPEADGPQQTGQ